MEALRGLAALGNVVVTIVIGLTAASLAQRSRSGWNGRAMSTVTRTCPKCSKTMEQGLLVDHAHYGIPIRQTWVAGEPRKDMFSSNKMPKGREIKITTWMCGSCGYLESYADR